MPTLELKNVSYAYEKGKAVLQNVSGSLETGKMYAILGPSGSGKTTLLSLLGGLDVPTQGSVLFDGEDITAKGLEHHRRNHISLIFQSYNLIDYMTPVENVRLTAKLDAAPILERLGLEQDEIARNVLKLSGGQQQRFLLARALYKDAPVLVLDEPTAALDPLAEYEIYKRFDEIVEDKTAIYISHRLSSCRFCDKIAVFHEGRLIQQGTHEELVEDRAGKYYEMWNTQAQYYVEA